MKILHGEGKRYQLISEEGELLIVDDNYHSYENSTWFTVGHPDTDMPDSSLLEKAKLVVDLLNVKKERDKNV